LVDVLNISIIDNSFNLVVNLFTLWRYGNWFQSF